MPDEMDEIIADFVSEADETLERLDPMFVELESRGHDAEILHEIFRGMHTIKGAAGFLGFQPIVDVAHRSENILKKLRDNEISISSALMDAVLESADMLKLQLAHVRQKDGLWEDTAGLLERLDRALDAAVSGGPSQAEAPAAETAEPKPESAPLAEAEAPEAAAVKPGPVREAPSGEEERILDQVPQAAGQPAGAPAKEQAQTLRIDVGRVDKVMDLTGEIVLVRNRLLNISNYLEEKYSGDEYVESLIDTVSFLDLVTSDMQLAVMKIRMQPLKKVFSKFPRLIRDLSASIGKAVDLVISGEGTEVDRSVIEQIGDPMVHIIRNAVDHAIEPASERKKLGKPEKGLVRIDAFQQGNQIIIEVSDDGKGIDVARVKRKAVEKRLVSEEEAQRMNDDAAVNLIFLPGFSTQDVATEISGRGVGMDVVKTNISKLNGYVEVHTAKGEGTTFRIIIPLTLAIIQALMVRANGTQYAIPLSPIEETRKVRSGELENITGRQVLVVRDRVLPVFELSGILGCATASGAEHRYVVVLVIGDRRFCIAVDELLGQEEVVIKNVEGIDTNMAGIVGATITGDGKVVLILDLAGISRTVFGTARAV